MERHINWHTETYVCLYVCAFVRLCFATFIGNHTVSTLPSNSSNGFSVGENDVFIFDVSDFLYVCKGKTEGIITAGGNQFLTQNIHWPLL